MNGRENDKGSGSLLEKGARREELKEEGKKVNGEKCTKFDTAWNWVGNLEGGAGKTMILTDGGLSIVTAIDKPEDNNATETTSEDIGDVANGILKADAWDATRWIDSHRGGCCVGRAADKESRCVVLKLFYG